RIFYGTRQQAIQRPISTCLAIQRMRGNISTVTLCCISQQVTGISFGFPPVFKPRLAMASIRISRLFFGDIQEVSVTPSRHRNRSEEHTSELQSRFDLVCRLLLEKKKNTNRTATL